MQLCEFIVLTRRKSIQSPVEQYSSPRQMCRVGLKQRQTSLTATSAVPTRLNNTLFGNYSRLIP